MVAVVVGAWGSSFKAVLRTLLRKSLFGPQPLKTVINLPCVPDNLSVLPPIRPFDARSATSERHVRVLIIEDESRIGEILKSGLQRADFAVDVVKSCGDAREALSLTAYDAAILDLGLPDGDGLALLSELRASHNGLPILILTARVQWKIVYRGSIPVPTTTW
jgi:hypothetical protein